MDLVYCMFPPLQDSTGEDGDLPRALLGARRGLAHCRNLAFVLVGKMFWLRGPRQMPDPWGQGHPSVGFSKASPYTFSKPPDPKFAREMSLVALWVRGFARPECLWRKAVFPMPVLLPLIYLRSFSKSLRRHPPDCLRGRCRRAISGRNCDWIYLVKNSLETLLPFHLGRCIA